MPTLHFSALNSKSIGKTMTNTRVVENKILGYLAFAAALVFVGVFSKPVQAVECTPDGAYGETCVYDKNFEVEKKVRLQGDSDWEDKVVDVPEGKVIEFRIRIKNVGEVEVDSMKMIDLLPDELLKTGGAGLTEYWEDFSPDETKTFIIEARIKDSEFDRTDSFEKCVVNKASGYYSDDLVGSDTATVCYSNKKITELPKAGIDSTQAMALAGFASTGIGLAIRKRLGGV